MCRWLAYSGSPILLEELLYKPEHSLIDQSLHARLGVDTTNGDGFGVGWYGPEAQTPAVFHSIEPAWNDRNLREVAGHVQSPLFLAHIRASTGTAVQQTNCHPFRHGRWLWVHNGLVRDFPRLKRDLALAVEESLYASIEGSTDSELLFYLALTFGLEDDPPGAVERMVGFVEEVGHRHGTQLPIQTTIGTTDGNTVWAFKYSSERDWRTLYYSSDVRALRELYPDRPRLREVTDEARIIVSEPLGDLPGVWNEVPESSYGVVREGQDELRPFRPAERSTLRPSGSACQGMPQATWVSVTLVRSLAEGGQLDEAQTVLERALSARRDVLGYHGLRGRGAARIGCRRASRFPPTSSAAARRSVTLRHTRLDLQSSAHQESSPPVTLAVAIKRRVCRTMDLFASAL